MGQVAVSPDGKRLAWEQHGKEGAEIRVAAIDDLAKSERVTAAKADQHCHEGQFIWAPDSKGLAFFSDCAKAGEQTDLYVQTLGSAARRLTELKGYVDAPAFSPDGKSVAFLYVEGATRAAGALAAMKPPAGVIGEDGSRLSGLRWRMWMGPSLLRRLWRRLPTCMYMSSTGARIRRDWRMWRPIRRGRTTGGWRSSTPRSWAERRRLFWRQRRFQGAARIADCSAEVVAGREGDCVYRRLDERPGRYGRRRMDCFRRRGPAGESDAAAAHFAGVD